MPPCEPVAVVLWLLLVVETVLVLAVGLSRLWQPDDAKDGE